MFKHVLKYQNKPTVINTQIQTKHMLDEHINIISFNTFIALVSVFQTTELGSKGQKESYIS